ncbi:hypothetical protein HPP92_001407 [Vanilla planifolia]|uniref:Uncharacterized protein n=1 Tax=Vanilla planifolia TaxID=51239 RepID=A0A835RZ81_VANPL|nr:hypothetical protein HPP92_001563 [Vanilla planifolia]KAG0501335.1 hypothetical protein HPP92_001407 [Vanilla planifolia]
MSRARLGLYVFCRLSLFEQCYELQPTFQLLLKRPDRLALNLDEATPFTERHVGETGRIHFVSGIQEMDGLVNFKMHQLYQVQVMGQLYPACQEPSLHPNGLQVSPSQDKVEDSEMPLANGDVLQEKVKDAEEAENRDKVGCDEGNASQEKAKDNIEDTEMPLAIGDVLQEKVRNAEEAENREKVEDPNMPFGICVEGNAPQEKVGCTEEAKDNVKDTFMPIAVCDEGNTVQEKAGCAEEAKENAEDTEMPLANGDVLPEKVRDAEEAENRDTVEDTNMAIAICDEGNGQQEKARCAEEATDNVKDTVIPIAVCDEGNTPHEKAACAEKAKEKDEVEDTDMPIAVCDEVSAPREKDWCADEAKEKDNIEDTRMPFSREDDASTPPEKVRETDDVEGKGKVGDFPLMGDSGNTSQELGLGEIRNDE